MGSWFWINLWVKHLSSQAKKKKKGITSVGSVLIGVPFVQKYTCFIPVFKNEKVQKGNVTQKNLYNLKQVVLLRKKD